VKCVRNGHEAYRVTRPRVEMAMAAQAAVDSPG